MTNIRLYTCLYTITHGRARADGGERSYPIEAFTTEKVAEANAWGKQPGNFVETFLANWDEYDEAINGIFVQGEAT